MYTVYYSFRDVFPLWAYLHKSYTYVVGLYRDKALIGYHIDSAGNPVSLKELGAVAEELFPPRIEELAEYICKNRGRVTYSREQSRALYQDDGTVIRDQ